MRLEFWFDFSCPYAYIGATQIERVAREGGGDLRWKPMLLGGVFRAVQTPDVPAAVMPPPKVRMNGLDMHRWADVYGVPLQVPADHPMRTVRALRALLSLAEERWPPVIHAFYRAYWVEGRRIDEEDTVRSVLEASGVTGDDLARALWANDDPAIKEDLRARTEEAIRRGVFGAPTMFVGDGPEPLMFWGQDRLHFVEKALRGWRPLD